LHHASDCRQCAKPRAHRPYCRPRFPETRHAGRNAAVPSARSDADLGLRSGDRGTGVAPRRLRRRRGVGELHAAVVAREGGRAFWRSVAAGVARGERALLVADDAAGIVGTVQLVLAQPENQPHRADLSKMLVCDAMRAGAASALR
jgi:hypothetical protein